MDSAASRCRDEFAIIAATVDQLSMRLRGLTERRSRSMSAKSRRLFQVGCCVRAVVVIVMVDVSSSRFLLVEGGARGVDMKEECVRRHEKLELQRRA